MRSRRGRGQTASSPESPSSTRSAQQSLMARDPERRSVAGHARPTFPTHRRDSPPPPMPEPAKRIGGRRANDRLANQAVQGPRRISASASSRDSTGNTATRPRLILPDGQLGTPNRLIPTDEPFQPLTADQLESRLQKGPFAEYHVLKTEPLPDLLQVDSGLCAR